MQRSFPRYCFGCFGRVLVLLVFAVSLTHGLADVEQHLDVLQVGTQVYRNVTVTTQKKDYVIILHSGGLASLKLSELSDENLQTLGYKAPAPKPKPAPELKAPVSTPAPASPQKVASTAHEVQRHFEGITLHIDPALLSKISVRSLVPAILIAVAFHVFFSYCGLRICGKTGIKPGAMIWLPLLQLIPMFCAAGMSPLWVIGMPLPVVNIVAVVIWSFRIAKACRKSAWVGICLLAPVVNLIALAYLAFSDTAEADTESSGGALTLETA